MAGDNWELPKPIFRSSEGTEAGVAATPEVSDFIEPDTLVPVADGNLSSLYSPPDETPDEAPQPAAASVVVEEQPFISEQLTAERIVPEIPASAKPAKKTGSSFGTILAILFLILAALVAVLYYVFFIRQPADTTF
ncbi:MAG TPA: hypothetical protein PKA82_16730 [Pyrinomonadaceae bacterium]|nr:hypothetical protein [Pyrinomonadaceae bacterium]